MYTPHIIGSYDPIVKNRLLKESQLNHSRAIEICKGAEESKQIIKNIQEFQVGAIHNNIQSKQQSKPNTSSTKSLNENINNAPDQHLIEILINKKGNTENAARNSHN